MPSSRGEAEVSTGTEPVVLTRQQRDCVEFRPEGSLLVRGIPGSGKTTVLLERARWLQEMGEHVTAGPKVLVLTYNRSLATYVRQLSLKSGPNPVEAMTFHQWGMQLLADVGIGPLGLIGDEQEEAIKFARNIVRKQNPGAQFPLGSRNRAEDRAQIRFLRDEIAWIKGQGIRSRDEYLRAERTGRGNQVHQQHRETIYDVLEKYNELLLKRYRKIDPEDVALLLEQHVPRIVRLNIGPSHVLVDEAQDLTASQFRAIAKLTARSLTIAADKGQKIYRRQFTWKSVGIDVQRARSRSLARTFRSTREIILLARSLQEHDHLLQGDEEYVPAEIPESRGPKPELYSSPDLNAEIATVIGWVHARWKALPGHTIAIIAYSQDRLQEFAAALDAAHVPWLRVKENGADILSPGAKLATFHSAKGLEFDHVIVTGLRDGVIPFGSMPPGEDQEEFLATERRKLYVAMTRAKLTLALSAVQPVSPFVLDLDSSLYIRR